MRKIKIDDIFLITLKYTLNVPNKKQINNYCLFNDYNILYAGPDDDGSIVWSDDDGSVYASDDDGSIVWSDTLQCKI